MADNQPEEFNAIEILNKAIIPHDYMFTVGKKHRVYNLVYKPESDANESLAEHTAKHLACAKEVLALVKASEIDEKLKERFVEELELKIRTLGK